MCGCDLVALCGPSPELVVIGEMKQSFTPSNWCFRPLISTSACDVRGSGLPLSFSKRGGPEE